MDRGRMGQNPSLFNIFIIDLKTPVTALAGCPCCGHRSDSKEELFPFLVIICSPYWVTQQKTNFRADVSTGALMRGSLQLVASVAVLIQEHFIHTLILWNKQPRHRSTGLIFTGRLLNPSLPDHNMHHLQSEFSKINLG